jgi:GT2 family glycosyltransferase
MVEFMDAHPDTGVLGCRLRYPNGEVQLTAHGDTRWQDHLFQAVGLHLLLPRSPMFGHGDCTHLPLESDSLVSEVGYVAGAALMVPTSTLPSVGFLDERIRFTGEDWEWCRRYAAHGYRVMYFAGTQIIHYHGMSTIRYAGRDRNLVRWKSIMHMTATSHYVYRKLHPDATLRILLFSIAFRLHWLTRVVSHGVLRPLMRRRLERGVVRGFWDGATMTYRRLAERFLDLDAPPTQAMPSPPRTLRS